MNNWIKIESFEWEDIAFSDSYPILIRIRLTGCERKQQAADLLCDPDEEVRAITSMSKKDVLMFLFQELADTKHAYLRDV